MGRFGHQYMKQARSAQLRCSLYGPTHQHTKLCNFPCDGHNAMQVQGGLSSYPLGCGAVGAGEDEAVDALLQARDVHDLDEVPLHGAQQRRVALALVLRVLTLQINCNPSGMTYCQHGTQPASVDRPHTTRHMLSSMSTSTTPAQRVIRLQDPGADTTSC